LQTVVIVVVTGIVVVILQKWIFRALRIKPDDFLALGLLFGVTSGAIGASGLLNSGQKRAAAIASLTFAIFGTVILVA
jgi:putative effector of murein hydrolase